MNSLVFVFQEAESIKAGHLNWNKREFENLGVSKKNLMGELSRLDETKGV